MRRLSFFFVFFFLIFASASAQNIWGLLSSNPTYSLLRLELNRKAPGLVSLFTSSTSNVTLFAPVEEAMYDSVAYFSSSPQTEIVRIFSYHTVAGALPTSYIATQYVLPSMLLPDSLGGRPQRLLISADTATPPTIRVNTSLIINPDTMATNGIVHGIDSILWPPNVTVYDTLVARQPAQFTTLIGALNSLGLDVTLKSNGGWTLFAPTDSAFAQFQAAQPAVYQAIVSHPPTFTKFLNYHMSSTLVYAGELPLENSLVRSLEGSNFTISKIANQMSINGYAVTTTNILCRNGVLHVIDKLLVPADFVPSLRIIMRGQNLTSMISQMDANGLSALLDDTTQNHTIYAPTNAAFSAVSSVTADVLNYHATDDVEPLAVLQNGELESTHLRLASLLGFAQVVKVSRDANNTIYINNAKVLSGDYTASNGIVHIIDRVMTLPSDLPSLLRSNPNLSTLTSLLNSSGLLNSAIASNGLSLFAPTNAAFSLVDSQVMRYLGRPLATPVLQNLLAYHVINGSTAGQQIYYARNVPSGVNSITMLSGEAALFNKTSGAVNINNKANVISVDTLAANGVLHTVDAVVVPPSFVFDLQKALVGVDATSFLSLVSNSSLASLLTGNTSFTIFAPTNAALAALQSVPTGDALLNLLRYHFVAGTVMGNSLTNTQVVPTLLFPAGLGGAAQVLRVNITSGAVYINSANVTMRNNTAINGVVHVIDRVLTPPSDVGTILASNPSFSTYNTLLQASGLASLVTGANSTNVTVFAPENGGFGIINSFVVQYLQRPSMLPILRNIVQYHIALSSVLYSVNIPMGASNVTVANNLVVTVVKTANSITVNGVNVTRPDILASNGVVHAVRGLILPPNLYDFGLIRALNAVNATAFLDAADTANVTPLLVTSQKRTVFAPSNKAFSAVDIMPTGDALVSLLKYHLVNGSFVTSQLQDRMLLLSNLNLTSLRGNAQRLRITIDTDDGSIAVNNATILIHNEVASNGVVHVVEKVLFPPLDILSVAGVLPQNCSTFVYAAQFAGLATIFKRSALTSFIPTNQAFRGLPKNLLKYLLLGPVAAQDLNAFVTYHLINQFLIYSQDFPVQGTYTTQQGQPLVLGRITGPMGRRILKANDANVVTSALAANGVIHVLDEVLIPPFFQFTLDKLLLALDSELFRAYLTKAKLQEYILSTDPVTFFVPTDNAFIGDAPNLNRLQRNELVQLMANHIVRGKYDNIEPGDRLLTLSGKTLIVSGDENSNTLYVTLEGNVKTETLAVIIGGSVNPALNGDVYQISHVLLREGNEHLEPGTIASIVLLSLLAAVVLVGFAAYVYKQLKDPSYHQL